MSFEPSVTLRDLYGRVRSAMSPRAGLARSLSLTVGTSVFIQLVTVGSGVVLARALGPQGRGDLAIAMLWPALVSGVGMLGIGDALTFRAALEGSRPSVALTNSLVLALIQSCLLGAVGWGVILIALHSNPTVSSEALFYLWYIPLNLLTLYLGAFLQGRMIIGSFNLMRASVHIAYSGLLVALWATNHVQVKSALAASLAANAITLCLGATLVVRGHYFALQVVRTELRLLLSLGLKLHLGNVAFLMTSRVDLAVLSFLVSSREVGDYVVATAVATLPFLIPSAASLVLYPEFSRLTSAEAHRTFSLFILLALLLAVIACPIVVLISPAVLRIFFGAAFADAAAIAQILSVASVLRGLSVMISSVLRGLGAPIRASGGDVVGFAVIAVSLIPSIQLARTDGAAFAVLLGAAASAMWMLYHGVRVTRISLGDLGRAWAAALIHVHPVKQTRDNE